MRALCGPDPSYACPAEPLTDDEQRTLSERLHDLSSDIRFVAAGADIPARESPDAVPGIEFVFLGIPQEQDDGMFSIGANVMRKGRSCSGGATYVLVYHDGVWTSVGRAPGTPGRGSPPTT